MKPKLLFILVTVAVVSIPLLLWLLPQSLDWVIYLVAIVAIVLLLLLLQCVIMPHQVVMRGMELVGAQDFNNRLTLTGERESDRIVTLFNTIIDRLRNERLNNMERENFLHLLIEASPMGVLMLDFDGRVTMANDAFLKITGIRERGMIVGKFIEEAPMGLAQSMQGVALGENRVIRDGDVRMYRCYHLSFIQIGFRREFYLIESLTEEVMRAERAAYEKVIRTISHEVNNTMGGVRSVLNTLLDIMDDDEVQKVLQSCDRRCEQMCGFVSAYADVVRLPDPHKQWLDLNEELARLVPFMGMMVREGISIEFEPAETPVMADIDSELMQQVFVNILKNAAESIETEEGRIWIRTSNENGTSAVDISNNGKPIDEAVSRQLFSPFFTTKKEGRGVGLTLSAEILNRHGSYFRLFTGEDGITRFHIEFP